MSSLSAVLIFATGAISDLQLTGSSRPKLLHISVQVSDSSCQLEQIICSTLEGCLPCFFFLCFLPFAPGSCKQQATRRQAESYCKCFRPACSFSLLPLPQPPDRCGSSAVMLTAAHASGMAARVPPSTRSGHAACFCNLPTAPSPASVHKRFSSTVVRVRWLARLPSTDARSLLLWCLNLASPG